MILSKSQLTLCLAEITNLERTTVYSVFHKHWIPLPPFSLHKVINNRVRPFSITEELSVTVQSGPQLFATHWPPKSQFTLLVNNQNGSWTCEAFLCRDRKYYVWFLTRWRQIFFPQNKCVVEVKNHLRSCNLSRTKVTEYYLIWARAGKLNLSHEEAKKMVFCPVYRQSLGIIILAAT